METLMKQPLPLTCGTYGQDYFLGGQSLGDRLVLLLRETIRPGVAPRDIIERFYGFIVENNIPIRDEDLAMLLTELKNHATTDRAKYDPKGILESGELHPALSLRIEAVLKQARAEGLNVFLFEGHRSIQKQNRLFNSGRGVTRARGGSSFHNYGLAADIVFYDQQGKPSWSPRHNWKRLGEIGKAMGLGWGGDFRRIKDMAHFEYHPDLAISDVIKIYKKDGLKGVWDAVST